MKKVWMVLIVACSIFLITGCQASTNDSSNEEEETNETSSSNDEFPATVSIDDKEITIEKQPTKMMPLSLEVAEIILDLAPAERVVATTRGIDDPILSSKDSIAAAIDGRIQAASNIDAEEIISYDTDLLVMTKMYGQEEDAEKTFDKLDVPVLAFDAFVSWEDFMEAYAIIGKAIGEKEQAVMNREAMEAEMADIQASIPDGESPRVLVLSEVGGDLGPMMMGPSNISYDMIQLAGAEPAVDTIDLNRSTPASMEQIIKMNPDYILFVDFFGKGEEAFTDLLEDPGWDTLDAVKNDQTTLMDAKYIINPNPELVKGLEAIVDWLYE